MSFLESLNSFQPSEIGFLGSAVVFSLLIAGRAYFFGGIGILLRKAPPLNQHRVSELSISRARLRSEIFAGLSNFVVDGVLFGAGIYLGLIRFEARSSAQEVLLTFLLLFVFYEIWFYFLHRALHSEPLYWIHHQHHLGENPHPLTAYSFSILERSIFTAVGLGFIALVSRQMPISSLGFAAFALFGVMNGVIGHLNLELFPKFFIRSKVCTLFTTATYHSMHHKYQRGHYGLATTVLDRFFGTCRWNEYKELFRRVS